jgi:hypothetical protein
MTKEQLEEMGIYPAQNGHPKFVHVCEIPNIRLWIDNDTTHKSILQAVAKDAYRNGIADGRESMSKEIKMLLGI